jgi:hypothetical protein
LEQVSRSDIFKLYESVRDVSSKSACHGCPTTAPCGVSVAISSKVKLPPTLFLEETDPRSEFSKVVTEMSAHTGELPQLW